MTDLESLLRKLLDEAAKPRPLAVGSREAAKLIGVSERWLHEQVKLGRIPHKRCNGRILFALRQLEEWLTN